MIDKFIYDIGRIVIFNESQSQLIGCIAIDKNNNNNYKSIGGTRFAHYSCIKEAVEDSIRLAKTMTIKCEMAKLPYIGAKAIIIKNNNIADHYKLLRDYGKMINELNGNFITGCDMGITDDDMKIINEICPYITGLSRNKRDYLSYFTALGIVEAMKISMANIYGVNTLKDLKILIQGVGKVGKCLAEILYEEKAILTITDIDANKAKVLSLSLSCETVNNKELFNNKYDIFAPCALGDILDANNIHKLQCKLICGSANNPIHDLNILDELHSRNIVFIPDWLSNIGGLIYAAMSYQKTSLDEIENYIKYIIKLRTNEFTDFYIHHDLLTAVRKLSLLK